MDKQVDTKKYYIKTFGCQMNVYDSNRIANILNTLGYEEAPTPKAADPKKSFPI